MVEKSVDRATVKMLTRAREENISLVWDRLAAQEPQCGFGQLGVCCRNCNMGPCRIDPFGDGPAEGVCGATADTIVARNLVRAIAAGAAAHSDHGRGIASTLYASAKGEAKDYTVKDEAKLKAVAGEFGIVTEGRPVGDIALELGSRVLDEFGTIKGHLQFVNRVPGKRRELWNKLGISPRGIDREVVECMHRTTMGVDNDYVSLILQGIRTALSDGWGGSVVATEISDILFGTPKPVTGSCNLGVLKEDQVNIILHGHEPTLSDMIVQAARDPELLQEAGKRGAAGINICGICCTANEILMRHGVPVAGNFLQQELAILTGAVDAMIVDIQCIMPSLPQIAGCYHTKIISTSPKAKFPGAEHMPFDEHNALEVAKKIVLEAVRNYSRRNPDKVYIPSMQMDYMAGFSVEAILEALGGTLNPLLDAVKSGAIKGIVAVVGCNNPKYTQDNSHLTFVRKLIANDILVVATGCAAIACAKDGLLLPGAAGEAGQGLRGLCQELKLPPVLHMGSCVDISRIMTMAAAIANALGVDIADLPLAGAAPEWMSEKAVSIGTYVVGSGIFTILGTIPPVLGSKNVAGLLTSGAEGVVGAVFAVEEDPSAAADLAIRHIEGKRSALGL